MGRAVQDSDCEGAKARRREGAKARRQVNLTSLAQVEGHYDCPIAEPAIATRFDLKLHIRIVQSESSDRGPLIRYGATDVGGSVEKALNAKLPKLAKTPATCGYCCLNGVGGG